MKITDLETIRIGEWPNLLWVRLHTDAGIVGLGEAYKGVRAVEGYLHETVAPYLLGKDARDIEGIDNDIKRFQFSLAGIGAETRGNSAVNIALWDLSGRATRQPLYRLLGGRSRETIRIYNTCAGPQYQRSKPRQSVSNFGRPDHAQPAGHYEDLHAFLNHPAELALDSGPSPNRAQRFRHRRRSPGNRQ